MPREQRNEAAETRIDHLIEQMFDVLPAASYAEIAERLSRRTRSTVTKATVGALLSRLRCNADSYGWTVPHVKRGVNVDSQKRLIRAISGRDGKWEMEESPENYQIVKGGVASSLSYVNTLMQNAVAALMICSDNVRARNQSAEFKEYADDLGYLARKAGRLLDRMREAA